HTRTDHDWSSDVCSSDLSDLQGMRTSARRDGDDWVINGSKTFISSGIMADLVVLATRTDPDAGSRGFTLFVVERDTPGFERGRKIGRASCRGRGWMWGGA